jgi:transposase-like protein
VTEHTDEADEIFDKLRDFAPEVEVVDWPARSRAQWRLRTQRENEARYGKIPRNSWPGGKMLPGEADERDYWVTKLYQEQGLTLQATAEQMGLHQSTISGAVKRLGIGRGHGSYGEGRVKQVRQQGRRELVRRLHQSGANVAEIASELGYGKSTVRSDLKAMGLPYEPPDTSMGLRPQATTELVENAVRQLKGIADVVLKTRLGEVQATEDQIKTWIEDLADVGIAVRKLRKQVRGRQA